MLSRPWSALFLVLSGTLALACTAGSPGAVDDGSNMDAGSNDGLNAGNGNDGGNNSNPDGGAIPVACPVDTPLVVSDALTAQAGQGSQEDAQNPARNVLIVGAQIKVETNNKADLLELSFWDGFGPFAAGTVANGTFNVEGDPQNCGVCAFLYGDADQATGPAKAFIATSGSITLSSVTGSATGSISNLVFQELDIATGTLLAGSSCGTSLPAATFTAMIQQ